jgi:hypothetical protein
MAARDTGLCQLAVRNGVGRQHGSGARVDRRAGDGSGGRCGDAGCGSAGVAAGRPDATAACAHPDRGGTPRAHRCADTRCAPVGLADADAEPDTAGYAHRGFVRALDRRRSRRASSAAHRCSCRVAHRDHRAAARIDHQYQRGDTGRRPTAAQGKTTHGGRAAVVQGLLTRRILVAVLGSQRGGADC